MLGLFEAGELSLEIAALTLSRAWAGSAISESRAARAISIFQGVEAFFDLFPVIDRLIFMLLAVQNIRFVFC